MDGLNIYHLCETSGDNTSTICDYALEDIVTNPQGYTAIREKCQASVHYLPYRTLL